MPSAVTTVAPAGPPGAILPGPGSGGSVGSGAGVVMLTAKNIQCMKALLTVAHCHGGHLEAAWHLVLTTLQHLAWVLGLRPHSGSEQAKSDTSNANSRDTQGEGGGRELEGECLVILHVLSRISG